MDWGFRAVALLMSACGILSAADTATFEKPISPAKGIDTVWCNGAIAWRDGKPGGGRSGRVLRRGEKA